MRILFIFLVLVLTYSCKNENPKSVEPTTQKADESTPKATTNSISENNIEETSLAPQEYEDSLSKRVVAPTSKWDLRAELSQEEFNQLQGAELEMAMMRPIYRKIFELDENDDEVVPELNTAQKCMYYFKKLDEAATSGEAIDIDEKQWAIMKQSLEALNDEALNQILSQAATSKTIQTKSAMSPFNEQYQAIEKQVHQKMEEYIRNHADELVKIKE